MRSLKYALIAATALCASPVFAADMPQKAPNYLAPGGVSDPWSGIYFGGSAGGAWVSSDPSFGTTLKGFTYGGHLGFQVQRGWLVVGAEAGVTNFANVKANGFGCDCLVADLLGKVGVAVAPTVLAYAVAGGFWHNASVFSLPQFGWTVGGGFDWRPFGEHIVIGPRYQYRNLDVPNTNLTVFAHEAKVHLDYKF